MCHSELSCVIPSAAEGPRIFLNAGRPTPSTDQTPSSTLSARALFLVSFRALLDSSASTSRSPERSRRGRIPALFLPVALLVVILEPPQRRIPDPSSPLPMRERIEGEGPYIAALCSRATQDSASALLSVICHSRAQRRIPDLFLLLSPQRRGSKARVQISRAALR